MSSIRSAVEDVCSRSVDDLAGAALEEELDELTWVERAVAARRLALIARIDRVRPYVSEGFLSTSSWVAVRYHESSSVATENVKTARALEEMPATREALGEGEISGSSVRVLVGAHDSSPEPFDEAEPMLVDAAK
ncbi:MAG TPA: DUF222 domain-containing protein, partial [Actinomycetota bacterium]